MSSADLVIFCRTLNRGRPLYRGRPVNVYFLRAPMQLPPGIKTFDAVLEGKIESYGDAWVEARGGKAFRDGGAAAPWTELVRKVLPADPSEGGAAGIRARAKPDVTLSFRGSPGAEFTLRLRLRWGADRESIVTYGPLTFSGSPVREDPEERERRRTEDAAAKELWAEACRTANADRRKAALRQAAYRYRKAHRDEINERARQKRAQEREQREDAELFGLFLADDT